jgi:phosphoribosyl 1,2-cyclic phosphodiesterase
MSLFSPLFSGSSGNATFIGSAHGGILVDAGVSAKRLCDSLQQLGCQPQNIHGIFITHEHVDHIAGLRVFAAKHKIPVFASAETTAALLNDEKTANSVDITPFTHSVDIADMQVIRFGTMHDCAGSSGYVITLPDGKRVAVCTDLGVITDEVMQHLSSCNLVMLESNHDLRMLQNGSYPYPLKQRILSDHGHLSNNCCADALANLLDSGTTRFMLAHLSRDNNRPHIAREAAVNALALRGAEQNVDYILGVAAPCGNGIEVL